LKYFYARAAVYIIIKSLLPKCEENSSRLPVKVQYKYLRGGLVGWTNHSPISASGAAG